MSFNKKNNNSNSKNYNESYNKNYNNNYKNKKKKKKFVDLESVEIKFQDQNPFEEIKKKYNQIIEKMDKYEHFSFQTNYEIELEKKGKNSGEYSPQEYAEEVMDDVFEMYDDHYKIFREYFLFGKKQHEIRKEDNKKIKAIEAAYANFINKTRREKNNFLEPYGGDMLTQRYNKIMEEKKEKEKFNIKSIQGLPSVIDVKFDGENFQYDKKGSQFSSDWIYDDKSKEEILNSIKHDVIIEVYDIDEDILYKYTINFQSKQYKREILDLHYMKNINKKNEQEKLEKKNKRMETYRQYQQEILNRKIEDEYINIIRENKEKENEKEVESNMLRNEINEENNNKLNKENKENSNILLIEVDDKIQNDEKNKELIKENNEETMLGNNTTINNMINTEIKKENEDLKEIKRENKKEEKEKDKIQSEINIKNYNEYDKMIENFKKENKDTFYYELLRKNFDDMSDEEKKTTFDNLIEENPCFNIFEMCDELKALLFDVDVYNYFIHDKIQREILYSFYRYSQLIKRKNYLNKKELEELKEVEKKFNDKQIQLLMEKYELEEPPRKLSIKIFEKNMVRRYFKIIKHNKEETWINFKKKHIEEQEKEIELIKSYEKTTIVQDYLLKKFEEQKKENSKNVFNNNMIDTKNENKVEKIFNSESETELTKSYVIFKNYKVKTEFQKKFIEKFENKYPKKIQELEENRIKMKEINKKINLYEKMCNYKYFTPENQKMFDDLENDIDIINYQTNNIRSEIDAINKYKNLRAPQRKRLENLNNDLKYLNEKKREIYLKNQIKKEEDENNKMYDKELKEIFTSNKEIKRNNLQKQIKKNSKNIFEGLINNIDLSSDDEISENENNKNNSIIKTIDIKIENEDENQINGKSVNSNENNIVIEGKKNFIEIKKKNFNLENVYNNNNINKKDKIEKILNIFRCKKLESYFNKFKKLIIGKKQNQFEIVKNESIFYYDKYDLKYFQKKFLIQFQRIKEQELNDLYNDVKEDVGKMYEELFKIKLEIDNMINNLVNKKFMEIQNVINYEIESKLKNNNNSGKKQILKNNHNLSYEYINFELENKNNYKIKKNKELIINNEINFVVDKNNIKKKNPNIIVENINFYIKANEEDEEEFISNLKKEIENESEPEKPIKIKEKTSNDNFDYLSDIEIYEDAIIVEYPKKPIYKNCEYTKKENCRDCHSIEDCKKKRVVNKEFLITKEYKIKKNEDKKGKKENVVKSDLNNSKKKIFLKNNEIKETPNEEKNLIFNIYKKKDNDKDYIDVINYRIYNNEKDNKFKKYPENKEENIMTLDSYKFVKKSVPTLPLNHKFFIDLGGYINFNDKVILIKLINFINLTPNKYLVKLNCSNNTKDILYYILNNNNLIDPKILIIKIRYNDEKEENIIIKNLKYRSKNTKNLDIRFE